MDFRSSGWIVRNRFSQTSFTGGMVIMVASNFQQEDDLGEIILNIITDYQPITTMDIWFELGEDERFKGGITRAEVSETLFQLEKQKIITKEDDDKWEINKSSPLKWIVHGYNESKGGT